MSEHGGNIEKIAKQLGVSISSLVDFSANINPLGIPEILTQEWANILNKMQHYPDNDYEACKQAIAKYMGVSTEQVLVSNGAAQAFFEIATALKPKTVLLLAPTFSEYRQAFSQVDAQFLTVPLQESRDYQWDVQDILPTLELLKAGDMVVICNPNNPTGSLVEKNTLMQIAQKALAKGINCLIDEAFMEFVDSEDKYSVVSLLELLPNVVVVRSLTKFYAIPGLRLGFVLSANVALLTRIHETRVPWSVNGISAQSAPLLLSAKSFQKETLQWLQVERDWLYQALSAFKWLHVVKPSVNYIFFKHQKDTDLREQLLTKGIIIRSCANYDGLTPQHYRVAVKSHEDNLKLISALKEIDDDRHG